MNENHGSIERVLIVSHPQLPNAGFVAEEISKALEQYGVYSKSLFLNKEEIISELKEIKYDVFFAIGGDGSMLRAGHICGPQDIPILGINMGRFGFLMEVREEKWKAVIPDLLAGNYWLEERMMLSAEHWRDDVKSSEWDVLNEVVVSRGEIIRPVQLRTFVDDRYLTTYVADALIVATPTGSTAYSLATGGPILPPELRNILLVPVAPHLSIDRAIVLSEGSTVRIIIKTEHKAVMSADGQPPIHLNDGDLIKASSSDHTVKFIRFQDPGYFYRNLTPHMSRNPSAMEQT